MNKMTQEKVCDYLNECPSRPRDNPNCIHNYKKCLCYIYMKQEEEKQKMENSGLIRFLRRKKHAKEKGFDWDENQLGIGSKM